MIRTGQTVPFKKGTNDEIKKRVETVQGWICRGLRKSEIHRRCREEWAIVSRHADRYMSRARVELQAELGKTREEHRADALGVYSAIVADPNASNRDRISARMAIDDLLGLKDKPRIAVEVTASQKSSPEEIDRRIREVYGLPFSPIPAENQRSA